jgi:hypothetical protein
MTPVLGKTATPRGEENFALEAGPSAKPAVPVPARVETTPPGYVMERMRWLPWSATMTAPVDRTMA